MLPVLRPLPTAPPPQQYNAPLLCRAQCTLPPYRLVTTLTVTAPPELLLDPAPRDEPPPTEDDPPTLDALEEDAATSELDGLTALLPLLLLLLLPDPANDEEPLPPEEGAALEPPMDEAREDDPTAWEDDRDIPEDACAELLRPPDDEDDEDEDDDDDEEELLLPAGLVQPNSRPSGRPTTATWMRMGKSCSRTAFRCPCRTCGSATRTTLRYARGWCLVYTACSRTRLTWV